MSTALTSTTHAVDTPTEDAGPVQPHEMLIRAQGTWKGSMRTGVRTRAFQFEADEPEFIGGTDAAPTPMEYMVGSINACLNVVVEHTAAEVGIDVQAVETSCLATMDTRGFTGTAQVQPHFHACRVVAHIQTAEQDSQRLARFTELVESRCPALSLVRAAGVDVDFSWHFAEHLDAGAAERECNQAEALSRGLAAQALETQ